MLNSSDVKLFPFQNLSSQVQIYHFVSTWCSNFITNSHPQGTLNNSEFIPKLSESASLDLAPFDFLKSSGSGAFQAIGKEGKYIKNVSLKLPWQEKS